MQLEKIEVAADTLSEVQQDDLFMAIVRGKDATEIITTSRGDFKVKFPKPRDLEAMARITANKLANIPASCFSLQNYSLMQQVAALDVVIVEGPAWYQLAKKNNPNFSWADVPSIAYLQEVYALAYNFRLKVQGLIDGNSPEVNPGMDEHEAPSNAGDTGAFEGLSG